MAVLALTPDGQYVISNGQVVVHDGLEAAAQRLQTRFQVATGDIFFEPDAGIPYFDSILGQEFRPATLRSLVRQSLASDPDFLEIVGPVEFRHDPLTRILTGHCTVVVRTGEQISIESNIKP